MTNIFQSVVVAAIRIHESGWRRYIRRILFCVEVLIQWRNVSLLIGNSAPKSLVLTFQVRPESMGILVWPYINNAWSVSKRVAAVVAHHKILAEEALIDVQIGRKLQILDLNYIFENLSVVIDRPRWFMREGELSLNLFVAEERIYSIAFTLAWEAGSRIAYIGGIQGRNIPEVQVLYHELTKRTHGCRPRDFLIQIFAYLCKRFSIQTMYAVSEAHRHHRHPYFGKTHKSKNSSNYDEIWTERGGVLDASGFYVLDVNSNRRSLDDIHAKKRSMYKKRYELFDRVEMELQGRFS